MLHIQSSFQDTPGDGFYFVLFYDGRPLSEQLGPLGLKDGDAVLLYDPECGDFTIQAKLLFDYRHPMMSGPALWARATPISS